MYDIDSFIAKREKLDALVAKAATIAKRNTVSFPSDPYFAVGDFGSNSVRLVIYDCSRPAPAVFLRYHVKAGLARGMTKERPVLDAEGMAVASAAFSDFKSLLTAARIREEHIDCFATAAMRNAKGTSLGNAFHVTSQHILGRKIKIISGHAEARLGAEGLIVGWPLTNKPITGIGADLGGGSLELMLLVDGKIKHAISIPHGALTLAATSKEKATAHLPAPEVARRIVHGHLADHGWLRDGGPIFVMGGNWRAIGQLWQDDHGKDAKLHGFSINGDFARTRTGGIISGAALQSHRAKGIIAGREDSIAFAAVALEELSKVIRPNDIYFSTHGAREGAVARMMAQQKNRLAAALAA